MLTRRFILGGLVAAPAVIAADKLMPVRSIVKPYATVWGVGWDLEVVEHSVWTPQDALNFSRHWDNGLGKFREVTEVVYTNPLPPFSVPVARSNHWVERQWPIATVNGDGTVVNENGFTRFMGNLETDQWRESLRKDLDGVCGPKWIEKQIRLNEANGLSKLDGVPYYSRQGVPTIAAQQIGIRRHGA